MRELRAALAVVAGALCLAILALVIAGCGPSEPDRLKYTSREKLAAMVRPGVPLYTFEPQPDPAAVDALRVHLDEFAREFGEVPDVPVRLYGGRRPFADPRPGQPPGAQIAGLYWDGAVWLWAGNDNRVFWAAHEFYHALLEDHATAQSPALWQDNPYGLDPQHYHPEWWRADDVTTRALARLP